eukprot:541978_1
MIMAQTMCLISIPTKKCEKQSIQHYQCDHIEPSKSLRNGIHPYTTCQTIHAYPDMLLLRFAIINGWTKMRKQREEPPLPPSFSYHNKDATFIVSIDIDAIQRVVY